MSVSDLKRQQDRTLARAALALHLDQPFERFELIFLLQHDLAFDFLRAGARPERSAP